MKIFSILAAFALAISGGVNAQVLNICQDNVIYAFPAAEMGNVVTGGTRTITVMGAVFDMDNVTRMYVDNSQPESNTVSVLYSDGMATVTVAGNIARYITAEVDGAHVSVTQSSEAGDSSGEITYSLSGSSNDGSFALSGSYKVTLELRGLTLLNPDGAVLDIQNGKRIALSAKSGTVNTLTDGAGGIQKGAIVCKGHLELKGKGELKVSGNTSHAIYAKEYVEIKNCKINVLKAVKDGVNCAQYFLMESGELNITNVGDDAVQTSYKDDADREAEDTGTIIVSGGKITASVTADAAKGLKADGDISMTGGEININVSGKGTWDSSKSKTKASSALSADGDINIKDGVLTLSASGSGGKGISCDGTLAIDGGNFDIRTTGGIYAYVNGKEYDGYTGNTDNLDSDAKSSPKGMKVDTELIIKGGNIFVSTTGKGGEGIESKGTLTINNGTITVNSYDDAINSSSHMYINGGDITVVATNNDGLDSNGNLYLNGGYIRAFGASAPECGIDANEEDGYSVIFTGGTMIAVGGSNSVPSSTSSTQCYVSKSGSAKAGSEITLKQGDTQLATFTVPDNYSSGYSGGGFGPGGFGGSSGSILITCPGIKSGSTYTLVNDSSSSSVTGTQRGSSGRPF